MSDIFTDAFDAIATALADMATATIRRGDETPIDGVLCQGLDRMRAQDDYGRIIGINGSVRLKTSEEPSPLFTEGDILDVTLDADSVTTTVRVIGRISSGGITRLTVQAEYE